MAKIYSAPPTIKDETNIRGSLDDYRKGLQKYDDDLQEYCLKHGEGPHRGEIIKTSVCDGYARYMVFGTKGGVKLIHINTCDGYRAQPAWERGLNLADIKAERNLNKRLEELFALQS
jgi:hypothetical protein